MIIRFFIHFTAYRHLSVKVAAILASYTIIKGNSNRWLLFSYKSPWGWNKSWHTPFADKGEHCSTLSDDIHYNVKFHFDFSKFKNLLISAICSFTKNDIASVKITTWGMSTYCGAAIRRGRFRRAVFNCVYIKMRTNVHLDRISHQATFQIYRSNPLRRCKKIMIKWFQCRLY